MKKRLLTLLAFTLTVLMLLSSCMISGNQGEPGNQGGKPGDPPSGGENTSKENLIFDLESELTFVFGDDVDPEVATRFCDKIFYAKGGIVDIKKSDSEKAEHEIVLGNDTGREITERALRVLERQDEKKMTEDDYAYVIYSDGSSVAIVYDTDHEDVAMNMALESDSNWSPS